MTVKKLELTSKLRPHQEEAARKFLKSKKGIILYHSPGTGKTLTSIKAAIDSGKNVEVIVPAPLVSNYGKELRKHLNVTPSNVRVRSYHKFLNNPSVSKDSVVILDEAHKIRNPTGKITAAIFNQKANIHKFLPDF